MSSYKTVVDRRLIPLALAIPAGLAVAVLAKVLGFGHDGRLWLSLGLLGPLAGLSTLYALPVQPRKSQGTNSKRKAPPKSERVARLAVSGPLLESRTAVEIEDIRAIEFGLLAEVADWDNAEKLQAAGVATVSELLQIGRDPRGPSKIAERTDLSVESVRRVIHRAGLRYMAGVPEEDIALLETVGVESISELAARDAPALWWAITTKLTEDVPSVSSVPPEGAVAMWVRFARKAIDEEQSGSEEG